VKRLFAAGVVLPALLGCGWTRIHDSDRAVNHQTREAGKMIAAEALEPSIRQAGSDVALNSNQIAAVIGEPESPRPYSPAASREERGKSHEEHQKPWFQTILGGLVGLLAGGLGRSLLLRFLPTVFGGPIGGVAMTLIESIARIRENVQSKPEGQQHVTEDELLAVISQLQEDAGVKKLAQKLAHKTEADLSLRL